MSVSERLPTKQELASFAVRSAMGLMVIGALNLPRVATAHELELPPSAPTEQICTPVKLERGETWQLHWDGSWKRRNPNGGLKVMTISGILNDWKDNIFKPIIDTSLPQANLDRHDVLPLSINNQRPYSREDTMQDPYQSIVNLNEEASCHMEQYPEDDVVIFGYSQGGYYDIEVAENLVRQYPGRVKTIVTFDGALYGANILPMNLDRHIARRILGPAGEFHVDRAENPNTTRLMDTRLRRLQAQGIKIATFASIGDHVVSHDEAHYDDGDTVFLGRPIQTKFNMSIEEVMRKTETITNNLKEYDLLEKLTDLPTSEESARLARVRSAQADLLGHGIVRQHPSVLASLRYILLDAIHRRAA